MLMDVKHLGSCLLQRQSCLMPELIPAPYSQYLYRLHQYTDNPCCILKCHEFLVEWQVKLS
jgi:hypothetical protein